MPISFFMSCDRRFRLLCVRLIGIIILLYSQPVWCLNLMDAYLIASKHDATLMIARASSLSDQERVPQALAQLLPSISAGFTNNVNHLSSTAENFIGAEQTTDSKYLSKNITLTARQPLYRPYQVALLRQTRYQQEESEYILQQAEQNMAVRVTEAYFDALFAEDQLLLVLNQKITYARKVISARKSLIAGVGTRTDVDEAQAQLDIARANEIEARQNASFALRRLSSIIDRPIGQLATINVQLFKPLAIEPDDVEKWIALAEKNNFNLKSIKSRLDAVNIEVDKMKAGHKPSLDAQIQLTQSDSENVTSINSRYKNAVIGLQLNIPIYSGGSISSQVRQSLANADRTRGELEFARRDLELRVYKEYRGITESIAKISAFEVSLYSAEQLVKSRRKSHAAGFSTVIDIMNADQMRATVLRDLAQARYLYATSLVRLYALVGNANSETIARVNGLLGQ